ncbi:hypothetical protein RLIN73S_03877 [Rhodanobacter lindaniclasticus]
MVVAASGCGRDHASAAEQPVAAHAGVDQVLGELGVGLGGEIVAEASAPGAAGHGLAAVVERAQAVVLAHEAQFGGPVRQAFAQQLLGAVHREVERADLAQGIGQHYLRIARAADAGYGIELERPGRYLAGVLLHAVDVELHLRRQRGRAEELRQRRGDVVRLQGEIGADLQSADAGCTRPGGGGGEGVADVHRDHAVRKRGAPAAVQAHRAIAPATIAAGRLHQGRGAEHAIRIERAQFAECAEAAIAVFGLGAVQVVVEQQARRGAGPRGRRLTQVEHLGFQMQQGERRDDVGGLLLAVVMGLHPRQAVQSHRVRGAGRDHEAELLQGGQRGPQCAVAVAEMGQTTIRAVERGFEEQVRAADGGHRVRLVDAQRRRAACRAEVGRACRCRMRGGGEQARQQQGLSERDRPARRLVWPARH